MPEDRLRDTPSDGSGSLAAGCPDAGITAQDTVQALPA
jgi:hypothetical protein